MNQTQDSTITDLLVELVADGTLEQETGLLILERLGIEPPTITVEVEVEIVVTLQAVGTVYREIEVAWGQDLDDLDQEVDVYDLADEVVADYDSVDVTDAEVVSISVV